MLINHLEWNLFDVFHHEDVDGLGGNAQTLSNPNGCDFQLVLLVTEFTTDANVASRQVHLSLFAQGNLYRLVASSILHTASLTKTYVFSLGLWSLPSGDGLTLHLPLPHRLRIHEAHFLTLDATNIQATDKFENTRSIRNIWQTV